MKRRIFVALGFAAGLALAWWLTSAITVKARSSKFDSDVDYLFAALQEYKQHVGSFPVGGNAQLAKALKGQNPKNVIIVVGRQIDLNEKGEFLDPWGAPLRVYFSDVGVLIRSAGPNRRFDDSNVEDADDCFRSI
ncbi:MAG: hypothetical protein JXQ71_07265 [Verrucomicrobia bacterium]|nr:hypothetical protein [Verrucomicrobiota bacterium]